MSFTIRLSQDLTAVDAGATVPLSIEIVNKGGETDRFEMQVEGIDPEWTASPEPVFNISPGETHSQKVFFKPPRASESLAGNYPFVVKVRSLESGDSRTAQGVLQIKPFHHISMEISPKKGHTSPMRQQNTFSLTVMNLGNTEHTLQLSGSDPEEECTYDFDNDQVTIGPGQQKIVETTVHASHAGLFSSSRLFGFVITARSVQNSNVAASTQAQLEQRPLISPGSLLTALALVAALVLWLMVRPKAPSIAVSVDTSNVTRGEAVHFHWKAANADSVRLEILHNKDNKVVDNEDDADLPLEGTKEILATNEDTITIHAFAVKENRQPEGANPVTVLVRAPINPPQPKITAFKASKSKVRLGETVLFTFDYSDDVNKLVLSPMTTEQVLPPAKQIQVTPTQVGTIEYQLLAYNKQGGSVTSKTIKVEVYQVSDAHIIQFRADPAVIQAPETKTSVSWNVTGAVLVQLDDGTGAGLKTVDPINNGMDVVTDHDVTLTLVATDAKQITTSKRLKIHIKPIPPPNITPATTGGPGGAPTTGSTGNTDGGQP